MKYPKLKLIVALVLSCYIYSNAQTPQRTVEEEIFCKNKNYQFSVENRIYLDNRKVYVCPKNLPVDIILVDTSNQNLIPDIVSWEIDGVSSSETSDTLRLNINDFANDKITVECNFTDTMVGSVNISLKVLKNQSLRFRESTGKYAFDDNMIDTFRTVYGGTEADNTPWTFLTTGQRDTLEAKAKKKNGVYAVDSIKSSDLIVIVDPNILSMRKQDIAFNHTVAGIDTIREIEIQGCDTIPELMIFAADFKMYDIEFIRVCETDDDMQTNPIGIILQSPTDVCVDGNSMGDLTIDLMSDSLFVKGDDSLIIDSMTGTYYIIAGLDTICQTAAHPSGPAQCPSFLDTAAYMSHANSILEKVGIRLNNTGMLSINVNYDTYGDNDGMSRLEQRDFHRYRHGNLTAAPMDSIIEVYIVNDLGIGSSSEGGNVQGRASFFGNWTVAIDRTDGIPEVLTHELGHAVWRLIHPGRPAVDEVSGQFGIDDKKNFMHGVTNEIEKWNIRRYQFHLIHQ